MSFVPAFALVFLVLAIGARLLSRPFVVRNISAIFWTATLGLVAVLTIMSHFSLRHGRMALRLLSVLCRHLVGIGIFFFIFGGDFGRRTQFRLWLHGYFFGLPVFTINDTPMSFSIAKNII
jgi:hypothetical protein